jgi:hypothetical protein
MMNAVSVNDASATPADASFAELAARRRGRVRRYLYRRPRVMDAVVVACYAVLVVPTVIDAVNAGRWAAIGLLAAVACPCSCGAGARWPWWCSLRWPRLA